MPQHESAEIIKKLDKTVLTILSSLIKMSIFPNRHPQYLIVYKFSELINPFIQFFFTTYISYASRKINSQFFN